ncbi:alpha/beta hydrolase family protein [Deinococcus arenicola]|uniref:Alpha/beta hydrolase n=1 Tax=Deinococcus arenicola TaxID=2994950 RepID=A0ABU4DQ46_9DEIO|nr:alpha/beta hydrolase [Deinococcus sp. ZS9-10]MDV6374553.1 alpha/beta hydrolase [Deinococcus sp. ZS9-10]
MNRFLCFVRRAGVVALLLPLAWSPPAQASSGAAAPLAQPVNWVALGPARRESLLRIPSSCTYLPCPLIVVSHPRNQTAARVRDSASVRVLMDALLAAHFAILISGDGGPSTWGSPKALKEVGQVHALALKRFSWNGRTYALGLSMGGLLSLRSALPTSPYRVSGVALIDPWTDLRGAWGSAVSRRNEINAAYGTTTAPTASLDPMLQVFKTSYLPLFVAASTGDKTVPAVPNGERLYPHASLGVSEFVPLTGPHMGGNRFSSSMAQKLAGFYKRLEGQAGRTAGK